MDMMNTVAATPVGTVTAGTAAGTGTSAAGAGFGQMLVQVMGGTATGQTTSGSMPDLVQLLKGLLASLPGDETALEKTNDLEALNALLSQLSGQTEQLDELLGNEEMQDWLMQAAMLLQGMQMLSVDSVSVTMNDGDQESSVFQVEGEGINRQQALDILKAFGKATLEQPNNIFLEQLRERLTAVTQAAISPKAVMAAEEPLSGTGMKGTSTEDLDVKIKTEVVAAPTKRLEILAAKSLPVNRLEAIMGNSEQTTSESNSAIVNDESNQSAAFPQDVNRLLPHKAALSEDGVVRSQSLVEDMSNFMLGKLRIQNGNGMTEARLTLTPDSLGQVDVKLTMQNGQLVAQFAAHTALGKEALESQMAQLRLALQSQGIQVEKLEVTQSPTLQSGMFHDQRHQQHSHQSNSQNGSNTSGDGTEEYAAEAAAILNGRKQPEKDGFDVTA